MNKNTFKVGLFAIGLDTYWEQFEGLEARLQGYLAVVEEKVSAIHPTMSTLG